MTVDDFPEPRRSGEKVPGLTTKVDTLEEANLIKERWHLLLANVYPEVWAKIPDYIPSIYGKTGFRTGKDRMESALLQISKVDGLVVPTSTFVHKIRSAMDQPTPPERIAATFFPAPKRVGPKTPGLTTNESPSRAVVLLEAWKKVRAGLSDDAIIRLLSPGIPGVEGKTGWRDGETRLRGFLTIIQNSIDALKNGVERKTYMVPSRILVKALLEARADRSKTERKTISAEELTRPRVTPRTETRIPVIIKTSFGDKEAYIRPEDLVKCLSVVIPGDKATL